MESRLDAEQKASLHDALYAHQYSREDYASVAMRETGLKTLLDHSRLRSSSKFSFYQSGIEVALLNLAISRLPEFRKDWEELKKGIPPEEAKIVDLALYENQLTRYDYRNSEFSQGTLTDLVRLTPNSTFKERWKWLEHLPSHRATESLTQLWQVPVEERPSYERVLRIKQLKDPESVRELADRVGVVDQDEVEMPDILVRVSATRLDEYLTDLERVDVESQENTLFRYARPLLLEARLFRLGQEQLERMSTRVIFRSFAAMISPWAWSRYFSIAKEDKHVRRELIEAKRRFEEETGLDLPPRCREVLRKIGGV